MENIMLRKKIPMALAAAFLLLASAPVAGLDCSDPSDCFSKGDLLCGDVFDTEQFSRAEPYFRQACHGGVSGACFRLGTHYGEQPGNGGAIRNFVKALSYFRKACDLKDDSGCSSAIELTVSAGEYCVMDPQNSSASGAAYTKGPNCISDADAFIGPRCDQNDPEACLALGKLHSHLDEPKASDRRAAGKGFTKACDLKSDEGCFMLGMHLLGIGSAATGDPDLHGAASAFGRACDLGFAEGCVALGNMTENGQGLSKEPDAALKLFDKACSLDSSDGCEKVAGYYDAGLGGVDQDLKLAEKYRKMAQKIQEDCDEDFC